MRRIEPYFPLSHELACKAGKPSRLMIDATHPKAHRTAASLLKRACSPTYRAHERRPELKLHAVCDGQGHPVVMLLSEGRMSDYKGQGCGSDD
jgi:hypothetical protein